MSTDSDTAVDGQRRAGAEAKPHKAEPTATRQAAPAGSERDPASATGDSPARDGEPGTGRPARRRRRSRRTRRTTEGSLPPAAGQPDVAAAAGERPDAKRPDARRRDAAPTGDSPDTAAQGPGQPGQGEKRRRRRRRRRKPGTAAASTNRPTAESAAEDSRSAGGQATGEPDPAAAPARPTSSFAFPSEDDWDIDGANTPARADAPASSLPPEAATHTSGQPKRPAQRRRRRSRRQTAAAGEAASASESASPPRGDSESSTDTRPTAEFLGPSPFELVHPEPDPDGADVLDSCADEEAKLEGTLRNVALVQFGGARVVATFDAGELQVTPGKRVLIESERGPVVGVAASASMRRMVPKRPPRVLGYLRPKDISYAERNAEREQQAYEFCRSQITNYKLPMKLIRVEFLHSGNKALFYFSAESRVDFRDLVRDLARKLRVRVEMRQVGVRDEAKIAGALGPCGQELCCSSWINDFHPVSIRMAKDQGLVLNPSKISGMCGRLKCCLAYEQRLYHEARKQLPKVGQQVRTADGEGRVQELDIPRKLVRVSGSDGTITTYPGSEVQVIPRSQPAKGSPRPQRGDAR